MLDDLGGEAMAPVAEQGHANILPDPPITPGLVSVTMPGPEIGESRVPLCAEDRARIFSGNAKRLLRM